MYKQCDCLYVFGVFFFMKYKVLAFHTGGYGIGLIDDDIKDFNANYDQFLVFDFKLNLFVRLGWDINCNGKLIPKSCKTNCIDFVYNCIKELQGDIMVLDNVKF